MTKSSNHENEFLNNIPWWVKSIILLLITGVICYKLIITPFNLEFDFPSFLSLLLALFSVALAALFYFKATDTSNAFYDNTYKFSQEIAGLLVKIESGFGEKLSHLDETYKGMRESFDKLPGRIEVKDAKRELKQEEKEVEKILSDKEKLINELIDKAQLQEEERTKFFQELGAKEAALQEAQSEINFLRGQLRPGPLRLDLTKSDEIKPGMLEFIREVVISKMGLENILGVDSGLIRRKFRRMINELPKEFIRDLTKHGMLIENGDLTRRGVGLFKQIAGEITDSLKD